MFMFCQIESKICVVCFFGFVLSVRVFLSNWSLILISSASDLILFDDI